MIITVLLIVAPVLGLVGLIISQAIDVGQSLTPWVQTQIANIRDQLGNYQDEFLSAISDLERFRRFLTWLRIPFSREA